MALSKSSAKRNRYTLADLEAMATIRPVKRGHLIRMGCGFHGSDNQRSLEVNTETRHFRCWSCGAWGYITDGQQRRFRSRPVRRARAVKPKEAATPLDVQALLAERLEKAQERLPGSPGQEYLESRGIPLELALKYGAGYIAQGQYAKRVVFPLHGPSGLMNSYLRSVAPRVAKGRKHRYLPVPNFGPRGVFNYAALRENKAIYLCESVFDALSLIAAGYPNSVALGGVNLMASWFEGQRRVILCLDADQGGQIALERMGNELRRMGKDVDYLPASESAPYKDLNELWAARREIKLEVPKGHLVREALKMGAVIVKD